MAMVAASWMPRPYCIIEAAGARQSSLGAVQLIKTPLTRLPRIPPCPLPWLFAPGCLIYLREWKR